jgi:hypothetical protein
MTLTLNKEQELILETISVVGVQNNEDGYRAQEFRDKLLSNVQFKDICEVIDAETNTFLKAIALRVLAMVPYKPIEAKAEIFARSLEVSVFDEFEPLYHFYCSLKVLLYFDNSYGIVQFAKLEKQMLALPPYQGRIDPCWFVETREEVEKWKMYRAHGLRWEQEPED